MRESLEGGDVAGQGVACCGGEGDLHRRERQGAIESNLPRFGPSGGGASGLTPGGMQLRSAAAGGEFLGEQQCPFSEGNDVKRAEPGTGRRAPGGVCFAVPGPVSRGATP
jgi:hypothetical protein